MNTDNNGSKPAYPLLDPNSSYYETGMTKREAFAMAAMQGILANHGLPCGWTIDDLAEKTKSVTDASVILADQLLKQLSQ